jgi:predicted Zn-dependent protease
LPFSRSHESEADLIGIELMARAGFDPAAAPALWRDMARAGGAQPPEWASTHPSHQTRIADLERSVPAAEVLWQAALGNGRRPDCE